MTPESALAAWAATRDEALAEHVADALRPDRLAALVDAARKAPRGREGERARAALRLACGSFLDRAVAAHDAEIQEILRAEGVPESGFEVAVAEALSPQHSSK